MSEFATTERTQIRRLPKRGVYDREAVYRILDEALICHVGFAMPGEAEQHSQPYVIPTGYGRVGDRLYIHGSAASRMLRTLSEGVPVCVTVTLLDGLVLARSGFHSSMNYRSVVILGTARVVEDAEEKTAALQAFSEHVMPGRWEEIRWPTEQELRATTVLELLLEEASAKVRTGGPLDDEADYALPVWAGVLPLRLTPLAPVPDPRMTRETEPPGYMKNYAR